MDTCIKFLCICLFVRIKKTFMKNNFCILFALHVNVGRLFFVFFLAYRHILITFVGTLS